MTTTMATPPRTEEQRLDALAVANKIRSKRKKLKEDLKTGKKTAVAVILKPPAFALTMRVHDLLLAAPKVGRVKANRVLTLCRISPAKTLGGLSQRQRVALVHELRYRYPSTAA